VAKIRRRGQGDAWTFTEDEPIMRAEHLRVIDGGKTTTTARAPAKTVAKPGRLNEADERDLRFYFGEYESLVGLRCTHEEMVAAIQGLRGTTGDIAYEMPIVKALEGGRQTNEYVRVMAQARRVRQILGRMVETPAGCKLVTVLNRFYGMRPPGELRVDVFGELATLVEYTPAIDAARAAMVTVATELRLAKSHEAMPDLAPVRREVVDAQIRKGTAREITTGDALRQLVEQADDVAFAWMVAAVKIEAEALLVSACLAYRIARATVPA
jgi:hypothetical protein